MLFLSCNQTHLMWVPKFHPLGVNWENNMSGRVTPIIVHVFLCVAFDRIGLGGHICCQFPTPYPLSPPILRGGRG